MARKKSGEQFTTYQDVFDEHLLRTVFELSSKGYFEELKSPISVGKESNIFTAKTKDGNEIIVKIYRINTADFAKMYSYIRGDSRFSGLNRQKRKVIYAWAQREYRNLLVVRDIGIRAPKPIAVKDNLLLMEFIGKNNNPCPKLKDKLPENVDKFAKQVIKQIELLYKNNLVHGDLSEFNILNEDDKPVFIDFSHSVRLNYPGALDLLKRDVVNCSNFFNRKGLKLDADKIFNKIVNKKEI